jgi:hypothetical protein
MNTISPNVNSGFLQTLLVLLKETGFNRTN